MRTYKYRRLVGRQAFSNVQSIARQAGSFRCDAYCGAATALIHVTSACSGPQQARARQASHKIYLTATTGLFCGHGHDFVTVYQAGRWFFHLRTTYDASGELRLSVLCLQPPWIVSWQDEINNGALGLTLPALAQRGWRRELLEGG